MQERDGRRGAGPNGLGNAAGANRTPQPGDWTCRGCRFNPNFSRRRDCFQCGRPRSPRGNERAASGSGPGDLTRGPVGAGGLRPLLGGRAAATGGAGAAAKEGDRPPTYRVLGASVAARTGAGGSSGTWADVARTQAPCGAAASPQAGAGTARTTTPSGQAGGDEDDEGFQVVVGRKGRKGSATVAVEETGARGGERPTDEGAQRDDDNGATRDAGQGDGVEASEQPTAADLQQNWHEEIALVKRLRGQGLSDDHPVMRAACASRDAAEKAWRGSKEPAPASIRLGRAQQKLDRAIALQAEARRAMLDAEAAHREKMSALQSTMDECVDRVKLRRQQLSAVQEEVGAGGAHVVGARRAQQDAIRQVHETICGEVGPAIAALVEQLDTEAPAWATLNGLLGKLAVSKATLDGATVQPAAQYDIGDDSGDNNNDAGDDATEWSESHDVHGQPWGGGDSGNGWHGWGEEQPHGADHDQSMGTGDWWDSPTRRWGGTARWQASGHGHWTKASWADQLEEEQGAMQDEDGQPPAARRRLDAAGGDQATKEAQAQEQQQQQQQSAAQPTEPGGPGGGAACDDPEERKRRHNARVNRIVAMAVEAGVTPLTKWGGGSCCA